MVYSSDSCHGRAYAILNFFVTLSNGVEHFKRELMNVESIT